MNIVLLQTRLKLEEIEQLLQEFPHFLFLSFSETTYKNLSLENWAHVEILYGNLLDEDDLKKAHHLHWIHSPSTELHTLCIDQIEKRGSIIISAVNEENLSQIGEFIIGTALAFSKNLFHFKEVGFASSKWKESMWVLKDKVFLQIGLDRIGGAICSKAQEFEMRVWGADLKKTFHPDCHKLFDLAEVQSILPRVDIVSITLGEASAPEGWFGKRELDLMKQGSLLMLHGNPKMIDEAALIEVAKTGKFKGILIDALERTPVAATSALWSIPGILITPDAAVQPKIQETQAFPLFRYNLRQYVHGNFKDMRNVVNREENIIV